MRFAAPFAVVLISATMVLAQAPKDPAVKMPPLPGTKPHSSQTAPLPAANTSAAQLAKIEQSTPRVRTTKPIVHHPTTTTATPALDLGKNKPVRAGRSPQPTNANGH
jgi:hypothetical protein